MEVRRENVDVVIIAMGVSEAHHWYERTEEVAKRKLAVSTDASKNSRDFRSCHVYIIARWCVFAEFYQVIDVDDEKPRHLSRGYSDKLICHWGGVA